MSEEAAPFDSEACLARVSRMWLRVGEAIENVISEPGEWIDSLKSAREAIEFTALAEACFWQATGENLPAPNVRDILIGFATPTPHKERSE